ncbi:MAG: hypothetical protein KDC01_14520, partial [Flavobacteriales bacterium]|nr:hypothetical protein [Flavobacteriales bacterium]
IKAPVHVEAFHADRPVPRLPAPSHTVAGSAGMQHLQGHCGRKKIGWTISHIARSCRLTDHFAGSHHQRTQDQVLQYVLRSHFPFVLCVH